MSLAVRALYASSGVATNVIQRGLSTFLLLFYNQVIGLPPKMVATAIMITLMVDAVSGPVIGQFSDSQRSRFGRRHPLMYASAIPAALAFYLLWNPPAFHSQGAIYLYLIGTLLAVRFFETCFELPASSLLPELTRDYNQRTSIIALRTLIGAVSGAVVTMLAYQVFLKEAPNGSGGVLARAGYSSFALTSAILIFVFILASTIGTHGRIAFLKVVPKRRIRLAEAAREIGSTLNNRSFIALTAAGTFCFIALGARGGLEIYFNIYYWGLRQSQLAILTGGIVAASLLGALIAPYFARRFGKRNAAIGILVASVLTSTAPVALRLVNLMPANGTDLLFALLLVDMMVYNTISTIIGVIVASMLADVVEDAEVKTGRRSEGLLLSAENMFWKMVSGVGVFVSGLMLALTAFPAHAERGGVAPETLRSLALVYVPSMVAIYALTIACIWFYRIDRTSHEANLARLAEIGMAPEAEISGEAGPAPQLAVFAIDGEEASIAAP
ncbi:MAG TPA: MFS transporter [Caulobacteraceae bacterium]|nr:MFS transporter [Caulobacteraceae bacterium]